VKVCSKCGIEKQDGEFRPHKNKCKSCNNERDRRYREENREKVLEYRRRYREENREKVSEYRRRYYEENREKVSEYRRRYYEENREKESERDRRYREENREKVLEYRRRYREENREKVLEGGAIINFAIRKVGIPASQLPEELKQAVAAHYWAKQALREVHK
jgi:hypothetical protein